jgi:hypothetical protein
LDAKITYLKGLDRDLKEERSFPLILHYNYNDVIKPRCEILKTRSDDFSLANAFKGEDGRFCHVYNVQPEELKQLKDKRKREVNDEKERLWVYVDQI